MLQVKEGDVIEVDTVMAEKGTAAGAGSQPQGSLVKRGRVVVTEIGARTRRGGYRLTLLRYKHYALFRRQFSTFPSFLKFITHYR